MEQLASDGNYTDERSGIMNLLWTMDEATPEERTPQLNFNLDEEIENITQTREIPKDPVKVAHLVSPPCYLCGARNASFLTPISKIPICVKCIAEHIS